MRKPLSYAILVTLALDAPLWAKSPKEQSQVGNSPSIPTATAQPASALPTPLPAELFQGQVREAYKAAGEIPDVFAGLKCYCGCDKSHGHRYLLDCFASDHGAGCNVCVGEALDAHALFMTGTPPDEIRKFIDQKYGH